MAGQNSLQEQFALGFELIDSASIPDRQPPNYSVLIPMWQADGSDDASKLAALRNEQFAAELKLAIPGLQLQPRTADSNDWEQIDAEALSPDVVYQRYNRSRLLSATWADGPLQRLSVHLCDGAIEIGVNSRGGDRTQLVSELDKIVANVSRITGMIPWDCDSRRTVPVDGVACAAVAARQVTLDRIDRTRRRTQLDARLGPYAAALMTILIFAGVAVVLSQALREGQLMVGAAQASPATFTTREVLPQARPWFLVPRFELSGTVDGRPQDVRLRVYRDEYIRATRGARYTVLSTGDAEEPWVLRQAGGGANLLIPLGGGNALPLGAVLMGAAGLGLWGWLIARPIVRRDQRRPNGVWIAMTRGCCFVLLLAALLAIVSIGRQLAS